MSNQPMMAALSAPRALGDVKAERSPLDNLVFAPSGNLGEDAKLRDAAAWLAARYPGLFPRTPTEVGIRDPGLGNDGSTEPFHGAVSIRPGMSREQTAGTLIHELLHSRVGSWAARKKQEVDELVRGDDEHAFLHALDQVVAAHVNLERQLGRAVTGPELLEREPSRGTIEYEENGAPVLVRKLSCEREGIAVERRSPAWSAIRASFEREAWR